MVWGRDRRRAVSRRDRIRECPAGRAWSGLPSTQAAEARVLPPRTDPPTSMLYLRPQPWRGILPFGGAMAPGTGRRGAGEQWSVVSGQSSVTPGNRKLPLRLRAIRQAQGRPFGAEPALGEVEWLRVPWAGSPRRIGGQAGSRKRPFDCAVRFAPGSAQEWTAESGRRTAAKPASTETERSTGRASPTRRAGSSRRPR